DGAPRGSNFLWRANSRSTRWHLLNPLAAPRQRFDAVNPWRITNAGPRRHANRSLPRHFHLGLDYVFSPISPARRHVTRQRKIRQRRHRDVMRPPDSRLQHPAAPHRNPLRLAQIVNPPRHRMPSHAPNLDVDNAARAYLNRRPRILVVMNALVETDRRIRLPLQLRVRVNIVPSQRLLHHDQVKPIKLLQVRGILQRVRRIRVNHQANARKSLAKGPRRLDILTRLDFDFDPLISGSQFLLHFSQQHIDRRLDPDRYSANNLV